MPYVWVAVAVAAVALEWMTSRARVAIWFAPAALVSMLLAFWEIYPWVQIVVFLAVAIVCGFAERALAGSSKKHIVTNIDDIIGEKGTVVEKVENIAGSGQVKVQGQSWSARSVSDDCDYEPGDVVHVVAVEGVTLICKK